TPNALASAFAEPAQRVGSVVERTPAHAGDATCPNGYRPSGDAPGTVPRASPKRPGLRDCPWDLLLGDEHECAADLAAAELVERLVRSIERERLHVRAHRHTRGEPQKLLAVAPR